jgi:hypothetical protein
MAKKFDFKYQVYKHLQANEGQHWFDRCRFWLPWPA